MEDKIERARQCYEVVRQTLGDDDPSPLPPSEEVRLAQGYAMIVGDVPVESFSRSLLTVREREASETAAAAKEV